jgi:hypothetical protein
MERRKSPSIHFAPSRQMNKKPEPPLEMYKYATSAARKEAEQRSGQIYPSTHPP